MTVTKVDNDNTSADGWFDLVNNAWTNVSAVGGETGLSCVYSQYDIDYSEVFGTNCTVNATNINCSLSAVEEGSYTYHIACKDAAGNKQSASQNTDFSFVIEVGNFK